MILFSNKEKETNKNRKLGQMKTIIKIELHIAVTRRVKTCNKVKSFNEYPKELSLELASDFSAIGQKVHPHLFQGFI